MSRTARYKYVWNPEHPLANSNGRLLEHRAVLYAKLGPGSHSCHWCGELVEWRVGDRRAQRSGMLMVDHLDADPLHNNPENLVPSCNGCNQARGPRAIQPGELFVIKGNGERSRAVQRVCQSCGQSFLHPAAATNPETGKFCSRACKGKGTVNRIREDEPFVNMSDGKRQRAEWRLCVACGDSFLHRISDKRPNAGRTCSRACANRARVL